MPDQTTYHEGDGVATPEHYAISPQDGSAYYLSVTDEFPPELVQVPLTREDGPDWEPGGPPFFGGGAVDWYRGIEDGADRERLLAIEGALLGRELAGERGIELFHGHSRVGGGLVAGVEPDRWAVADGEEGELYLYFRAGDLGGVKQGEWGLPLSRARLCRIVGHHPFEVGCDCDRCVSRLLRRAGIVEGARVRISRPVERWPHFRVDAGAEGEVREATPDLIAVRMDATVEGAEEWDNEVCWTDADFTDAIRDLEPVA